MASTKEQRIAAFSTLVLSLLLLITLMFLSFTMPEKKPEEQGILINFGDSEQGQGEVEPKLAETNNVEEEQKTEPVPVQQTVAKTDVGTEDVETQNFEEAAAIEKKKKETEKKKKDEEEIKKQQEIENQRLAEVERQKQIEIENQKRIAEEKRKQKEQRQQDSIRNRTKNAFNNAGRNPNGGNTGEGNTGGDGNQGALNGDINSKNRTGGGTGGDGIDLSLNGRSFRPGTVPPKPEYKSKEQGKVVVSITVDRDGNVIDAVPGEKGSTTTDQVLYRAAKEAALKAKFDSKSDAPAVQKGTITYNFILQ